MGLTSRLRTDKVLNSSYEENPIDYDLTIGYSGACALFVNNIALFVNNIAMQIHSWSVPWQPLQVQAAAVMKETFMSHVISC